MTDPKELKVKGAGSEAQTPEVKTEKETTPKVDYEKAYKKLQPEYEKVKRQNDAFSNQPAVDNTAHFMTQIQHLTEGLNVLMDSKEDGEDGVKSDKVSQWRKKTEAYMSNAEGARDLLVASGFEENDVRFSKALLSDNPKANVRATIQQVRKEKEAPQILTEDEVEKRVTAKLEELKNENIQENAENFVPPSGQPSGGVVGRWTTANVVDYDPRGKDTKTMMKETEELIKQVTSKK